MAQSFTETARIVMCFSFLQVAQKIDWNEYIDRILEASLQRAYYL